MTSNILQWTHRSVLESSQNLKKQKQKIDSSTLNKETYTNVGDNNGFNTHLKASYRYTDKGIGGSQNPRLPNKRAKLQLPIYQFSNKFQRRLKIESQI